MTTSVAWTRLASAAAIVGIVAIVTAGCARDGGDAPSADADPSTQVEASPGITDDSLVLGISTPLTGPVAGPGTCIYAGANAYFEAGNAAGGFEFGDGKTRKVTIKAYDDAYDPAKAVTNVRQMIADGVFGMIASLGTPTNLAVMPIAAEEEFPQALLLTGTPVFSADQVANPWTIGFLPTYFTEGEGFGKLLVERDAPITVATIIQNDDAGEGYLDGLKAAIEGSKVEIVAEATYEATDTNVDAQLARLAASDADVLFSIVFVNPLQVGSLLKAQELGWLPEVFVPSPTSSTVQILEPANAGVYPAVYTPVWAKNPADAEVTGDADVAKFSEDLAKYSSQITTTVVPHCAWSYTIAATLAEAFTHMTEPTRTDFMAAVRSISDYQPPLALPGIVVDTTDPGSGAIKVVQIWEYDGDAYSPLG